MITLKLGSAHWIFTQSIVDEGLESRSNEVGMISGLHAIDSIKLVFDLDPVNTALTICVSMHSKSMSTSSLSDNIFGHEILLRASASTLLCPHPYLMMKL